MSRVARRMRARCDSAHRAGAFMPAGRDCGFSIRTRLLRPVSPLRIVTCPGATAQDFARNFNRARLALPSTGGAVRRIFSRSPRMPAISSRLDRGWTRTLMISALSCQLYQSADIRAGQCASEYRGGSSSILASWIPSNATSGDRSSPEMGGIRRRQGLSTGSVKL